MTEWFVPGFKAGGPIKSVHLLAEMLHKQFEIYILTTNKDHLDSQAYKNVTPDEWVRMGDKYSVMYLSQVSASKIFSCIRNTRPKVIYINGLFSFYFSVLPIFFRLVGLSGAKLIIAPRGVLHDGALKFKRVKKKVYLWFLKFLQWHKSVVFHATDQQEKLDTLKHFPKANIEIIDNIIDLERYNRAIVRKEKGSVRLIFVSRITPKKNLLFLIDILSNFSNEIHLSIIGPINDKNYWDVCQAKIDSLQENISVDYLGAKKPEDVRSELVDHHFLVLPTFGENFGHVIAEALVQGVPILISDQTPWKDLKKKEIGWDINLNNIDLWRQTIVDIVDMDELQYTHLSNNAYRFIDTQFNRDDIESKYLKLLG